jgi:hypothetical protein
MLHYIFRLNNEDGMKIATSYDTNEYLSFQIGGKEVITGEQEWGKVSKFQKQIFLFSFEQKMNEIFFDFCPKDLK